MRQIRYSFYSLHIFFSLRSPSVASFLSFPGDEQVEEEPGEEGPAAGVLLGSLVVVVVLVLVLALLVRCLWARRGQEGHRGRGKSRGYAPPEKPGGGLSGEYRAGQSWTSDGVGGGGGHCMSSGSSNADFEV